MGRRGRTNFEDESFYFVTTNINDHYPLFHQEDFCKILVSNIKFYQNRFNFSILAYVIMPTHFHWIVKTDNKYGTISDIMRDLKQYSAKEVIKFLYKNNDRKMLDLFRKDNNSEKESFRIWESRFDDQVIRNEKMFWVKMKYIHNNPVKAGLVDSPEKYKYSSYRNYSKQYHDILFVDTDYAGIEMI